MVFQRDLLLEWRTVLDNVLLPIEVKRLRKADFVERAKSLLGLSGWAGSRIPIPASSRSACGSAPPLCRALIHDPPCC